MDATFVAAVLEGIEGTLAELIERVEGHDLCGRLVTLQQEMAAVRHLFEEVAAAAEVDTKQCHSAHCKLPRSPIHKGDSDEP